MKPLVLLSGILGLMIVNPARADDIHALIDQLAAPKVRLRDEAQSALAKMPEADAAIREAAEKHPSEEARLRAQRILRDAKTKLWEMTGEALVTTKSGGYTMLRGVAASPDGTMVAALHRGGVELLKADGPTPARLTGAPCMTSNGISGIQRSLAFSPDSKLVASTDHTGQVFIDDMDGKRVRTLPAETGKERPGDSDDPDIITTVSQIMEVWGIGFLPDGGGAIVYSQAGLAIHDFNGGERRLLPLATIFPVTGYPVIPRAFHLSADGKLAGLGVEVAGAKDRAALVSLPELEIKASWWLPAIPHDVAPAKDGSFAVIALRDGSVHLGTPGNETTKGIHRMPGTATRVAFSADETEAFLTCDKGPAPLRLIRVPGGEEIWSAPPAAQGFHSVAWLDAGRVVTVSNDCYVRLWKKRQAAPASK